MREHVALAQSFTTFRSGLGITTPHCLRFGLAEPKPGFTRLGMVRPTAEVVHQLAAWRVLAFGTSRVLVILPLTQHQMWMRDFVKWLRDNLDDQLRETVRTTDDLLFVRGGSGGWLTPIDSQVLDLRQHFHSEARTTTVLIPDLDATCGVHVLDGLRQSASSHDLFITCVR